MRKIIHFITYIGGHYIALELVVLTSFFGFSLNPGSLGEFMRIGAALFIFNLLIGNYRPRQITVGHIVFLSAFVWLLAIHLLVPDATVHRRSVRYFLAFPGLVMVLHCLAARRLSTENKLPQPVYSAAVMMAVLIQFIAYQFFKTDTSWGMYGNFHHLGYFAGLTIPLLWYFFTISKGWSRLYLFLMMLIDTYLLLGSGSRVAWFAYFVSILSTLVIFYKPRQICNGLFALAALCGLALLFSGISNAGNRIVDFFAHWRTEERIGLWTDIWRMLPENSLLDWIVGHGIGSFRYHYEIFRNTVGTGTTLFHVFPHNVFFQIIFENGLAGFVVILGGIAWLLVALRRAYNRLRDKKDQNLLVVTYALFLINLVYCGLTQSFYSKFSLYPLSLIFGMAFVLLEKAALNKPWHEFSFRSNSSKTPDGFRLDPPSDQTMTPLS